MAAKEPQGTSSPLLGEQDVAVCLEQGLTSEHDFQTIIAARPKRVVEWLQEEGVEKLGDFQIQVWPSSSTHPNTVTIIVLTLDEEHPLLSAPADERQR